MILVIGDPADPVIGRVDALLREGGSEVALLDASTASKYRLRGVPAAAGEVQRWKIEGGECRGDRAVHAVFVRRGPLASHAHRSPASLGVLVDRMLLRTSCKVINRPSKATGNYAKVHQLLELGAAGFTVPSTQVTAIPRAALEFVVAHRGRVLVKGLSSIKTVPQAVGPHHLRALEQIESCPVLLQEIVDGTDVRLTVVGRQAIASVARPDGEMKVTHGVEVLSPDLVQRCIEFTHRSGLGLSGFDFRVDPGGLVVVLEMNTNPLFTHYEDAQDPVISRALRAELLATDPKSGDILV
jgi:glutathione synthase/RimK-type ligase-like ATP-grasp enzyme